MWAPPLSSKGFWRYFPSRLYSIRMPGMKVIMIHNIGGVGRQNEIKDVADGYALNFLIPNGHAVHATAEKVKALQDRLAVERRSAEEKHKQVVQGIERLRGGSVRILARANDAGGLYRELTADMIVTAIVNTYGVRVPQNVIHIADPIKKIGQHTIHIMQAGHDTELRVIVAQNG